ncbi:MAG TPA: allantoate amidohydrolase [Jatrophihabitans sp.]|jgi:N-carbamoyl-L-amino-acid hydrolase|uniref:allantoate amidohydrolase n=1 Tax=Jatrophihabitans sp. TaxID=1932789 RepID=UPI002F02896E
MTDQPSFDRMWDELTPIGRSAATGGYQRFAWTRVDHDLREWFAGQAAGRGLSLTLDRAGNQWAWWGEPSAGLRGLAIGSHLDSVPDGGAFDGPLGVVSAFAAVDALRRQGFAPRRPIGIVNFGDEEGARFGIACAGSRLITGALPADRARALTDAEGTPMAEAMRASGLDPDSVGADPETLGRLECFVELHVEQGRGLVDLGQPVAVGSQIWPHGRWRIELPGEANHAGTTRLADRRDPMLAYARLILAAREAAERRGSVATMGKVSVFPNGVNAIPSRVTAWLDARGPDAEQVLAVVAELQALAGDAGGSLLRESWTEATRFEAALSDRISAVLPDAPALGTGAGHDAGILANAGIPTAMLFVRNPSGVSHSPAEHAELADCHAGVRALTSVVAELAG